MVPSFSGSIVNWIPGFCRLRWFYLSKCHQHINTKKMVGREQLALSRLRKDDTIVITPPDKGRVTVVMNKTEYGK